jgi:hypothetical protein
MTPRISAKPVPLQTNGSGASLPGFGLRPSLPAGILPTGVVVGDFNNDGKLDWAIANGGDSTVYIYLGNGDGTAKPPTIIALSGKSPVGLAAGDLNHDGNLDLVVAEADSQTVGVLLGNGDGTFQPEILLPAFAVPTAGVTILDVNGDGAPDLVVGLLGNSTSPVDSAFAVLLNNGTGSFGAPIYAPNSPPAQYPSAQTFSSGDVNNDGRPDLLVTSVSIWNGLQIYGGSVQIFLNNGDGTFAAGQVLDAPNGEGDNPQVVQNAVLADVNGDGCLDAISLDSYGNAEVYPGNCSGGFQTNLNAGALIYGMGDSAYGLVAADINGDGHPDIITGGVPLLNTQYDVGVATGNMLGVRLNDGTGHFGPLHVFTGEPGMFSLAIADLKNNGRPDVISANQDTNSATVFNNDGSGNFGPPSGGYDGEYEGSITGFSNPPFSGFFAEDVNGDGLPDLTLIEAQDAFTNLLQLTVMLNQGDGLFGMPIRTPVFRSDYLVGDFAFGDFRNTGQNDFVGVAYDDTLACGQPQLVFAPNNGGGSFGPAVQIPLTLTNSCFAFPAFAVGDFNHDGKLDFAVITTTAGPPIAPLQITVYLGNGDGTFRAPNQMNFAPSSGVFNYPPAVFVEDANGDGKQDLLVWMADNVYGPGVSGKDLLEFLGNGDGTFQQPIDVIQNLYAMTMRDLNHDGLLDVINIHSGSPQAEDAPGTAPAEVSTYLGNPDGSFTLKSTISPFVGYFDAFFGNNVSHPQSTFNPNPYIGDFSGDGNTDIAVFQRTEGLGSAYAQFLAGNGDGTFTPTYDTYQLGIFLAPDLVAENIFGDTRAAALYTPNYPASYSIMPSIVAPTIQANILEMPVLSGQDTLQISLNVPSSSSRSVTLSASDPGIQIPPSTTIPANTLEIGVPFTLAADFPANQWFSITAGSSGTTAIVYSFSAPPGGADPFSITAYGGFVPPGIASSPAPGQESAWTAVLSTNSMASSTFQVSCGGLPTGTSCDNFSPTELTVPPAGSETTNFTITPPLNLVPGIYPFTVSATDGYVTITNPSTLYVGDFTFNLSPASVMAQTTDTVNLAVNINYLFNYLQPVDLVCSGLPAGASCNASPNSGLVVLQLTQVALGNYTFTVTGTSNSLVHTTTVQLQVVSTPVVSFNPGQINIAPTVVGGTSSAAVQLSNSGSASLIIAGTTVSASGNAGTLSTSNTCGKTVSPGSTCTVSVTFAATATGTVSGMLTINDNASDSPQTLPVSAQGVDFSVQAAPGGSTSATVKAGQSATFSVEIVPNQFQGEVSLACQNPSSWVTCTLESGVNVTGSAPVTFSVTAATVAPSGQALWGHSDFGPNSGWFVGVGLFGLVLSLRSKSKRSSSGRLGYRVSLCGLLLLMVAVFFSCGGGGSSGGGGGNSGTPPGSYNFTINATAGGVTRELPLTLTVD